MYPFNPFPDQTQRFLRRGYFASVTRTDRQFGRLLDALVDSWGLSESTIVAVHGDHGWHLGEQGEWTKKTNFELGTRVPLMIRAPNKPASHGRRHAGLAELVDVYPTLAELAGLLTPLDLDGTSLVPAFSMDGASVVVKHYAFSQFPACPVDPTGVRHPLWASAEPPCQGVPRKETAYFGYSVRSENWRYTAWFHFECPQWPQNCSVDWSSAPFAEELYDHRGGVDAMMDFDSFDVENVVTDPANVAVRDKLLSALRMQFGSTDLNLVV